MAESDRHERMASVVSALGSSANDYFSGYVEFPAWSTFIHFASDDFPLSELIGLTRLLTRHHPGQDLR